MIVLFPRAIAATAAIDGHGGPVNHGDDPQQQPPKTNGDAGNGDEQQQPPAEGGDGAATGEQQGDQDAGGGGDDPEAGKGSE